MESPIKLRIENISAKICGRLFNLPRYEIQTQIRGLGIQLVRHVNVHVLLMSVMFRRKVSFELDFGNASSYITMWQRVFTKLMRPQKILLIPGFKFIA